MQIACRGVEPSLLICVSYCNAGHFSATFLTASLHPLLTTGALVGSLHGLEGLPSRWVNNLENKEMGKDAALQLGEHLAKVNVGDWMSA